MPRLRATSPPRAGNVYVGLAELCAGEAEGVEPVVTIADDATGSVVTVRWPDGACVVLPLPRPSDQRTGLMMDESRMINSGVTSTR